MTGFDPVLRFLIHIKARVLAGKAGKANLSTLLNSDVNSIDLSVLPIADQKTIAIALSMAEAELQMFPSAIARLEKLFLRIWYDQEVIDALKYVKGLRLKKYYADVAIQFPGSAMGSTSA